MISIIQTLESGTYYYGAVDFEAWVATELEDICSHAVYNCHCEEEVRDSARVYTWRELLAFRRKNGKLVRR